MAEEIVASGEGLEHVAETEEPSIDAVIEAPEVPALDLAIDPAASSELATMESAPTRSAARAGVPRDLPRLLTRIFDTPLLIDQSKLEVILAAIGPRLNLLLEPAAVVKTKGDAIDPSLLKPGALIAFDDDEDDRQSAKPYEMTPDGIAVLSVDGTLVYKSSWLGALSGLTSYAEVKSALDQAVEDPSVKGILLLVDSYGGEANGCFDLSDAVFAARSKKPLYGCAADDSYSGAYALLSATSKVFVSRTSGVGSVGVCVCHCDQSAADKMEGLRYTYIFSGARKVDGNPHEPLSTPALEAIQAESDRLRVLFAGSVARYRNLPVDEVMGTEATKFYGENAVAAKFADAVGTPDDALAALRGEIASRDAKAATAMPAMIETEGPAADVAEVTGVRKAVATLAEAAPEIPEDVKGPKGGGNVVDIASVRDQTRGEVAALHVEIIELCRLAGKAEIAAEFIRGGKSLAAVRTALQDQRVDVSDAQKTQGHIMPDADNGNAQAAAAGWDMAFAPYGAKEKGA